MTSLGFDLLLAIKTLSDRERELKRLVKKGIKPSRIASKLEVPVQMVKDKKRSLGI